MKKYLVILVIVVCFFINNKEEIKPVFDYNEEDITIVNIIIPNLNTNNFSDYFNEQLEIIGLYPKVNILYKDKIGNMFYSFSKDGIKANITSFIKYYKSVLRKNNFTNDLILTEYSGINIEKVKVYLSYEELNYFLRNCFNCTYEKIS